MTITTKANDARAGKHGGERDRSRRAHGLDRAGPARNARGSRDRGDRGSAADPRRVGTARALDTGARSGTSRHRRLRLRCVALACGLAVRVSVLKRHRLRVAVGELGNTAERTGDERSEVLALRCVPRNSGFRGRARSATGEEESEELDTCD